MNIPFLDLKAQYQSIKNEVNSAIQGVLDSCSFIMGPDVKELEKEVASYCGVEYGIGVASGTDALLLALLACDIGENAEVITTPFTFIATTEAISKVRAKITFIDIDPKTYNIDAVKLEQYITSRRPDVPTDRRIKAILPVHLYGHPCDMAPIMSLARKYNIKVIEDCAQAIGAVYKSREELTAKSEQRKVGSIGDVGCFSFFPSKNLGCYGDGGMVVTNDENIAEKVRMLRVHGCKTKYYHLVDGYNSRLDTLQAAVLRVKMKYIDQWNKARREKLLYYNKLFAELKEVITPAEADYATHVGYAYTIRVQNRDTLKAYLQQQGVDSQIYYPVPLHLQDVYKNLGYRPGSFEISERFSKEVLSLPIYPELTQEKQQYVVNTVKSFYAAKETKLAHNSR